MPGSFLWCFFYTILHLYHISLLPFILKSFCQIIVSPQQSDTGLSRLLLSVFPPEEKKGNLMFSLIFDKIVHFLLVMC